MSKFNFSNKSVKNSVNPVPMSSKIAWNAEKCSCISAHLCYELN